MERMMVLDHSWLRLVGILSGGYSINLGYQLFVLGVTGKASLAIKASTVDAQLLNAAPGIFFTLAGVMIILFSLFKTQTTILKGNLLPDFDDSRYTKYTDDVMQSIEKVKEVIATQRELSEELEKISEGNDFYRLHVSKSREIITTQRQIENHLDLIKKKVAEMEDRKSVIGIEASPRGFKKSAEDSELDVPSFLRRSVD